MKTANVYRDTFKVNTTTGCMEQTEKNALIKHFDDEFRAWGYFDELLDRAMWHDYSTEFHGKTLVIKKGKAVTFKFYIRKK